MALWSNPDPVQVNWISQMRVDSDIVARVLPGSSIRAMRPIDVILGFTVALAWGLNFVVIGLGLKEVPPMTLATVRFGLVGIVGAMFVPRPQVSLTTLVSVGGAIGIGQFGVLFIAIDRGMPAGLAGVVIQMQVVLTLGLARLLLKEPLTVRQVLGCGVASLGLVVLAIGTRRATPVEAFVLTCIAAAAWALANLQLRRTPEVNGLSMIVWSSLVSPVPLLALALFLDGPSEVAIGLREIITPGGAAGVVYQSIIATVLGWGIWIQLMSRHSAASVTPFALLVPVVSLCSTAVILGEPITPLIAFGSLTIVSGMAISMTHERASLTPSPETVPP